MTQNEKLLTAQIEKLIKLIENGEYITYSQVEEARKIVWNVRHGESDINSLKNKFI